MRNKSIKKILLTGHLGFIGSQLRKLLSKNYEVYGLDRASDIRENEVLEPHFKNIDLVIHCAAEISRIYGEEQPRLMIETNVLGTLNVVKLCVKYGAKLINFSTSEVYGLTLMDGDNFDEKTQLDPFKMTNIYGMSKLFAETIVRHYSLNYGLQAVSVRPFMVYGPGQVPSKYKSALDQFIDASLKGKILNVHKGSVRSWCHLFDFVQAIKLIVDKHKWNGYDIFNIGTEEYRSMKDVAKMIIKKIGKGKIKEVKPPKILVIKKKVNFNKIKRLGFKPLINLEEGLNGLIEWHKNR